MDLSGLTSMGATGGMSMPMDPTGGMGGMPSMSDLSGTATSGSDSNWSGANFGIGVMPQMPPPPGQLNMQTLALAAVVVLAVVAIKKGK